MSGDVQQLIIASYNIHRCIGIDGKFAPERTAAVIRELDTQVIGLQEVDIGHSALSEEGQAIDLGHLLGMQSVMGPTRATGKGHYGNALLTRCKVIAVRHLDLSYKDREPRGALDVDLVWRGEPLRYVVTHLGLGVQERMWQVKKLLESVKPATGDPLTVLAGDINEWVPGNRVISKIERAFGRTPHRRTFPAKAPFLPLDRIWVYPHGTLKETWVHASRVSKVASDHLPLVGKVVC